MSFSDIYTNARNAIRQNVPYGVRVAGKALTGGYTPELGGGLMGAADNAFLNPGSQGPTPQQSLTAGLQNTFGPPSQGQVLGAYDSNGPVQGPQKPAIDITQPLNSDPSLSGGGSAGPAIPTFQPIVYKGQQFNDLNSYQNAIHSDAVDQYNQQKKMLETAYQNGLISFDQAQGQINQNRENIKTQAQDLLINAQRSQQAIEGARGTSLSGISQYFSQNSPEAYQSTQGALEGKAVQQADQGLQDLNRSTAESQTSIDQALGGLNQDSQNLDRQKQSAVDQYQNNLTGLDTALRTQEDQLANNQLNFATQQQQARAAQSTARTAAVKQYDPTEVLKGLAGLYQQDTNSYGLSHDQAAANIKQTLQQTGLSAKDQAAIEQYFYGNFLPQFNAVQ